MQASSAPSPILSPPTTNAANPELPSAGRRAQGGQAQGTGQAPGGRRHKAQGAPSCSTAAMASRVTDSALMYRSASCSSISGRASLTCHAAAAAGGQRQQQQ